MTPRERDALENYMWSKNYIREDGTGAIVDDLPQKRQAVLNLLGDRYDMKRIDELAETYGRSLNAKAIRAAQERGEAQGHGSTWDKLWSSGLTVPAKLAGDLASPMIRLNELSNSTGRYSGFDPNGMGGLWDAYSQGVRGAVEEDIRGDGENSWRNIMSQAYLYGMEGLDSFAEGAVYGKIQPIMSAVGTFEDTITEASARGASYSDALMLATSNSVIDMITESEPLDKLADKMLASNGNGWDIVKRSVAQMGIELSSQEFELVASQLTDVAIMQDNSEYAQKIAEKVINGASCEDAKTDVSLDYLHQIRERAMLSIGFGAVGGLAKGTQDLLRLKRKEGGLSGSDAQLGDVTPAPEQLPDGRKLADVNRVVDEYSQTLREQAADALVAKMRDKNEYAKVEEALGKNAPKSLEDFLDLKYNSGNWEQFQSYWKSIESGKLSAMADFDLYRKISSEIDQSLVGVTTPNGIRIRSKSENFIALVIGSVEERRSGIDIEDIYAALTGPNTKVYPAKTSFNGSVSQKYRLGNVTVTVNPKTGNLIRVRS